MTRLPAIAYHGSCWGFCCPIVAAPVDVGDNHLQRTTFSPTNKKPPQIACQTPVGKWGQLTLSFPPLNPWSPGARHHRRRQRRRRQLGRSKGLCVCFQDAAAAAPEGIGCKRDKTRLLIGEEESPSWKGDKWKHVGRSYEPGVIFMHALHTLKRRWDKARERWCTDCWKRLVSLHVMWANLLIEMRRKRCIDASILTTWNSRNWDGSLHRKHLLACTTYRHHRSVKCCTRRQKTQSVSGAVYIPLSGMLHSRPAPPFRSSYRRTSVAAGS